MIVGREMLKNHKDLSNCIVTADALHCQRRTAQEIVANGGDYILQIKDNQKNLKRASEIKLKDIKKHIKTVEKGHGRIDSRKISLITVTPTSIEFPHAETLIKVQRASRKTDGTLSRETSFYVSSISKDKFNLKTWLQTIRNHWGGIEIRNHWRKDACLMEDKTRSKKPNIVAALAMLRNCYLKLFAEQDKYKSLPAFTEAITADANLSYAMITAKC
jgi:predicted transposase YbfD/YdcC